MCMTVCMHVNVQLPLFAETDLFYLAIEVIHISYAYTQFEKINNCDFSLQSSFPSTQQFHFPLPFLFYTDIT